jgi:hypothetical protein
MKKVWELPLGTAMLGVASSAEPPFGYPLYFARGFGKTGQAFSKSARTGAPPVISLNVRRQTRVILCQLSGPPALAMFCM